MIKQWFKDRESKRLYDEERSIADGFQVNDLDGRLYLTLWGTAFYEVDPQSTSEDICALLDDARSTAIKYKEKQTR